MDQNVIRTDLLPASMALWIIALLAAVGIVAWIVCHRLVAKHLSNKLNVWCRALCSLPVGTIASWLVLQALARLVFLATPWSLFLGAALSALSLEAVSAFYVHECSRIAPRIARILVACRMGAVATVLLVLMQPVIVADRDREVRERVVVLVDDSGSMHFRDRQLTEAEKADLEKALGAPVPKEGMTRADMVAKLVAKGGDDSFLQKVEEKFHVDVFRFGNGLQRLSSAAAAAEVSDEAPGASEKMFRSTTDLSGALERMLKEVPAEEISSVIVFTDGRHNGEAGVDSIARRLGGYGVNVTTVLVGGSVKPFDIAIAAADAKESVFLGDKVRFTVAVSATAANGRKGRLVLKDGKGTELDAKDFTVEGNDWQKEFRFTDLPKEHGLYHYSVEVKPVAGELFADNNRRELEVAVSDDRTNVLLVDGRPRWEYRYLRNLFYGRDKSVHLQDWIVHPDTVFGLQNELREYASASRAFGDSEAGGWPVQDRDWWQFDVIILGDLEEGVFTSEAIEQLKYDVEERGSLLVFIAGSEFLPMAYTNPALLDFLPVEIDPDGASHRTAPETEFIFRLTASGRGHPVMSQSSSAAENEEIWQNIPYFRWRLPVKGVKPGAEVLAYAEPRPQEGATEALLAGAAAQTEAIAASVEEDPESALRRLEQMRTVQARNALIVAQTRGKGRVLMLLTDNMWRLRSKAGDALHHRFWGQVMRWGAGEKLRSGNAYVRLGSDQLRYGAGETVKGYVRFLDGRHNGIDGLEPRLVVYESGSTRGRAFEAKKRPGSNGFYECEIPGCDKPGEYTVRLECPEAKEQLGDRMPAQLETSFVVVTTKRPAEEVDITATDAQVSRIAAATGGRVLKPSEYVTLDANLGGGSKTLSDRVEYPLWSLPPLFILVILLLTTEWILRKRASLS